MKYYKLRALEQDYLMLNFVGGHQDFDGVEALRRSSSDFWRFAKSRRRPEVQYNVKPAPWIAPLMLREHTQMEAPEIVVQEARASDIECTSVYLLISERARAVLEPLMPENTEILPVEVENSDDVFWVRPICIERALDVEKSYASILQGSSTIYERPVVLSRELNGENIFCFRESNPPIFSEKFVDAIKANDLYGVSFREIEVV